MMLMERLLLVLLPTLPIIGHAEYCEEQFTELLKDRPKTPMLKFCHAAENGDIHGQALMGLWFETNKNYQEVIKWYELASVQGHAESSAFLGYLYLSKEKAGINADKAKH